MNRLESSALLINSCTSQAGYGTNGISNSNSLFKIGSGWLFDVDNGIGYKVVREKGIEKDFKLAFMITSISEHELEEEGVSSTMEVPLGILRRAKHIARLRLNGRI